MSIIALIDSMSAFPHTRELEDPHWIWNWDANAGLEINIAAPLLSLPERTDKSENSSSIQPPARPSCNNCCRDA